MPEKEKRPQQRTAIKDLPKREKKLSKTEQKRVKGGYSPGLAGTASGPGASVDLYSKPKQ